MANKRKSRRSRISKAEEKKLNERIALGIGLTFIFVALFLLTWLIAEQEHEELYENDVPFNELSKADQIHFVKNEEAKTNDETNYQLAITMQDRNYCEDIDKLSLKLKCEDETPDTIVEKEPEPELDNQEISDNSNYQLAITFNDATYCESIANTETKNNCLKDTGN